MIRRHGPILLTAAAASLGFIGAMAVGTDWLFLTLSGASAAWFLAGLVYTQLFEYCVHRFPMHRGLPLLRAVRLNHIRHHRIFHGVNFRTRNTADLAHIPGVWWIFPVLCATHYAVLAYVLPPGAASVFLLACVLHYLVFEVTHWFTHLEDNAFDRALAKVPVLGDLRARQIEHHRMHHEIPVGAFNFTPPYTGDVIARGVARATAPRRPMAPRPAPVAAPPEPAPVLTRRRLLLRPVFLGAVVLLGAAAVGLAVLAHVRPTPGSPAPRAKV